jgi:MFS family permease
MLAAITMLAYNFTVTLPLFVTRGLGASETVFTMIYSVMAFGSVASALVVASRGHVTLRYVTIAAACLGGALLLLAASPGVAWAALAAFLTGGTSLAFMTANTTVVQLDSRRDMHGRMLALQTVCLGASALVGGPVLGWIADTMGGRTVMVVGGVTCLVAAALGSIAAGN